MNPTLEPMARDPKATEDYSKATEELLATVDGLVKAGRVEDIVDQMMVLEKQARESSDGTSVSKLGCRVIDIYLNELKDYEKVKEALFSLAKKRSQLRKPVTDMVAMVYVKLDSLPKNIRTDLIEALLKVTEGKIFVEVEWARLVSMKAQLKEEEGDVVGAVNLLQDVQVEAFGAMEMMEKTKYILNQMRLFLVKGDFIRTQIASKKINPKLLETDDFQEAKLTFYEYMIRYWVHEDDPLEVAKCYSRVYATKVVKEDEAKAARALTNYAVWLLLSSYNNEQRDLVHRLSAIEKKRLDKIPIVYDLLQLFIIDEMIQWPLKHEAQIQQFDAFKDSTDGSRWKLMHKRVRQRNIHVFALYYTTITLSKLSTFLCTGQGEVEAELSELHQDGSIQLKINRPAGVVKFGKDQNTLDSWFSDCHEMLDGVTRVRHMIQKEEMVHESRERQRKARAKAGQ